MPARRDLRILALVAGLAVLSGCARFPEPRLELATPDRTVVPDAEPVPVPGPGDSGEADRSPGIVTFYEPATTGWWGAAARRRRPSRGHPRRPA